MNTAEIIQMISVIITSLGICVTFIMNRKTLKQNQKMLEESSRPIIEFYKDKIDINSTKEYIVIKNFGKSSAKIESITYNEIYLRLICDTKFPNEIIKKFKYLSNSTLAPNQYYRIPVKTNDVNLETITFDIKYSSAVKKYNEAKTIYLKQDSEFYHNKEEQQLYKNNDSDQLKIFKELKTLSNTMQELLHRIT